ncbi:hypothetical protein CC78DRAFT_577742 [Lojkania enalia]|uniref:DUF3638 domain-containing protein n=1 Tax=Lojkania enalia TaxID=147567 RepID=A0A9P4N7M1_9PLEO|nr:hypothetical protein CC78DRAFT_577742 [Didymosphaeria enalia]
MAHVKNLPRTSPMFFLGQLNPERRRALPRIGIYAIMKYGLAVTELQRARILVSPSGKPLDFMEERRIRGHENWDPIESPENLLLEADKIVHQIKALPDVHNEGMQLNVGKGKSSVIVPMVAATLADGSQLVRVTVAKAQSKQMLQMLFRNSEDLPTVAPTICLISEY